MLLQVYNSMLYLQGDVIFISYLLDNLPVAYMRQYADNSFMENNKNPENSSPEYSRADAFQELCDEVNQRITVMIPSKPTYGPSFSSYLTYCNWRQTE